MAYVVPDLVVIIHDPPRRRVNTGRQKQGCATHHPQISSEFLANFGVYDPPRPHISTGRYRDKVCPTRQWREIRLGFFTVYLDDSGTAPGQPIASASALIIPANQILKLDENFPRFLAKYKIDYFHAAPCAAPNSREKIYNHLDVKDKKRIFDRMRQLCKKYGAQTFGFSVYKAHYDEIITGEYRRYSGSHYAWAVRHVVREVQSWKRDKRIKEPLEYIFDFETPGSDKRHEIDDVMLQMGELQNDNNEPLHHDFRDKKKFPGLQCVDLIAWTTLQLGLNNFRGKPLEGYARDCIRDFENYYPSGKVPVNKKWFQVPTVNKPNLKSWFDLEMRNPESIHWFRDWYKRNPNREALLEVRKNRV